MIETDVNKTNASKECDICHYWNFLDKEFKFNKGLNFQFLQCCCDLKQNAMNLNDVL